jgi:hypothetical protein
MSKNQPGWVKCLSENPFRDAVLSCTECCAFEFRKCDGCPNSVSVDVAHEAKDPMNSLTTRGWIRGIAQQPSAID